MGLAARVRLIGINRGLTANLLFLVLAYPIHKFPTRIEHISRKLGNRMEVNHG